MTARYTPTQVIPPELAEAVDRVPYWFVIGGQAVRCMSPYRPTGDVDFGVRDARSMKDLLAQLGRAGRTEVIEQSADTAHLRWKGIDVSIFVLPLFAGFIEGRRLNVTGVLATKLHAILDRGTRRDFFDLYVTLQDHRLGAVECLRAIREVYQQPVNEGLLLRALTYFDDADAEARIPGEGKRDWNTVKDFFLTAVGALIVPPAAVLDIQARTVDVTAPAHQRRAPAKRSGPAKRRRPAKGKR